MRRRGQQRIFAMLTVFVMLFSHIDYYSFADVGGETAGQPAGPVCGLEEHTHTPECYESVLTCGMEESGETERKYQKTFTVHHHTEACRDGAGNLICGLIENEYYHTHNEFCRDENGNTVCGTEKRVPHVHTEECYEDGVLICDKPTTTHQHTAACYNDQGRLTCGELEIPTFTSTADNWTEELVSEGHRHSESCYEKRLICGKTEHTHSEACYAQAAVTEAEAAVGESADKATEVGGADSTEEKQTEVREEELPQGETAEGTEGTQSGEQPAGSISGETTEEPKEGPAEEPVEEPAYEPDGKAEGASEDPSVGKSDTELTGQAEAGTPADPAGEDNPTEPAGNPTEENEPGEDIPAPAEQQPDGTTPSEGTPVGENPEEGTPADGTAAEGTPTEGKPIGETPTEGIPTEGTQTEGTPSGETITEGTPDEAAPESGKEPDRADSEGTLSEEASATEGIPVFEVNGDALIRYNGEEETVTIPDGIRIIDSRAFKDNRHIRTAILPDSVEIINNYAFENCTALEKVVTSAESRLETIGRGAFRNDRKLDTTFAEKVKFIVENAFECDPEEMPAEAETAESTEGKKEEQDGTPAETPIEEPAEEPDEEPAEEPEKEPEEEPKEDTTENPEDEPKEEPGEEPVVESIDTTTIPSTEDAPVRVTVTFTRDAGIPEGTELIVTDAVEKQDDEGNQETPQKRNSKKANSSMRLNMGRAAAAMEEEPHADIPSLITWQAEEEMPEIVLYSRTLDISLVADGEEIEPDPDAKITVSVTLPSVEDGQQIEVRHITENGSEVLESTNDNGTITFVTDGFSLFSFTSTAQKLSSWTTGLLENTFFGRTASQETAYEAISVENGTEGLDVLEAFSVTGSSDLWMSLRQIKDLMPGKLESIALYTVENGKLGAIVKENISLTDILRFSLSDLNSFALVRDSGLRRRTEEMTNVILSGMMPKHAAAEATDVTEDFSDFYADEQTVAAYDITIINEGEVYQPENSPVTVTLQNEQIAGALEAGKPLKLWHIIDENTREEITEFTTENGAVTFEASGFSAYVLTYAIEKIITLDGGTYKVTVSYGEDAEIPEGAELDIQLVDSADYLEKARAALNWTETDYVFYTKFLDISIVKDGEEVKPQAPVNVSIQLMDVEAGQENLQVVHFGEEGAEKVESQATEEAIVTFETPSFSVFGIGNALHEVQEAENELASVKILSFDTPAGPADEQEAAAAEEPNDPPATDAAEPMDESQDPSAADEAQDESAPETTQNESAQDEQEETITENDQQSESDEEEPAGNDDQQEEVQNTNHGLEEGLELIQTISVNNNKPLWIKAALKMDAALEDMESVSLYDNRNTPITEDLTTTGQLVTLDADVDSVAVVKDTGYRRLNFVVNIDPDASNGEVTSGAGENGEEAGTNETNYGEEPENGGEASCRIITLNGMMPKAAATDATVKVSDVTVQYAEYEYTVPEEEETEQSEEDTAQEDSTDPAATDEQETLPARTTLAAYDISILRQDAKYRPDEDHPINVEIIDSRITAAEGNIELWHIRDDGTEEEIKEFTVENGSIYFAAQSFSVYSIVMAPEFSGDAYGWHTISDLSEIKADRGYYLDHSFYYIIGEPVPSVSNDNNRKGLSATSEQYMESGVPSEAENSLFYFEKEENSDCYYIYRKNNGEKEYLEIYKVTSAAGRAGLRYGPQSTATAFSFKRAGNDRFKIYATVSGETYYWNRNTKQNQTGYGAIIGYNAENDPNVALIRIQYNGGSYPKDPYGLDGMQYSIVYYSEGVTGAGMLASETTMDSRARLLATPLVVHPSVLDNKGELLIAQNMDLSTWEFHCVRENYYQIKTDQGGITQYIALHDRNLVLTDDENDEQTLIRIESGSGAEKGKYRFSVGNYSIALMGGKAGNGFVSSNDAADKAWLNLVEEDNIIPEEDFQIYTAKKVSVSDTESVADGKQVVLYIRHWNDTEKKYEHYAVDHDGSLFRVYESGDTIQWVGSRINTALWDFTEYFETDENGDKHPNYFYELFNSYSEKYIAPQRNGSQTLSDKKIGINLTGRQEGRDYSTIIAWDQFYYEYAGLNHDETSKIMPSNLQNACDFYFAVMDLAEEGELTTVQTVDNDLYGIEMKIKDYGTGTGTDTIASNRAKIQSDFFGRDSDKAALLTTDLKADGYPMGDVAPGGSLSSLYSGASKVNHLFIQSTYNASGYFVYDSAQNYAYLNPENNGNFTVYDQLATIKDRDAESTWHGHFFPYNSLIDPTTNKPWAYDPTYTNQKDALLNELPDSDPRKGEKLHGIPQNDINYFYGMEMSASFTQTVSGLDAWGHDIIFEFSGDDDFWLYVDDELVLDLGGVHSAMSGKVNFRTGQVTASGERLLTCTKKNGKVEFKYTKEATLRQIFEANYRKRNAGASDTDVAEYLNGLFKENEDVFKDYTTHKMKIFYMERGAGGSNLKMRFNLASVKPGNILLSKELEGVSHAISMIGEYLYRIEYQLKIDDEGNTVTRVLTDTDPDVKVVYFGTSRPVRYESSVAIEGITYENVFLLKPGETAEIRMPDNAIQYRIIECGVDNRIYEKVEVNGIELDGVTQANNHADYDIGWAVTKERPRVPYINYVSQDALGKLEFTKKVVDESGDNEIENDPSIFDFRLYLGTEHDSYQNLPLANMFRYYVKNPDGYYCVWDTNTQSFISYGKKESSENEEEIMQDEDWEIVAFRTSMYGAISKIPVGYTVELREILFDTKFKVEERAGEIPDGYSIQKYIVNGDESITPAQGIIRGHQESEKVFVYNIKGWGLRLKKNWTDDSFMTNRDSTYFAVYRSPDGVENHLEMVPGTIKQLKFGESELYWYIPKLETYNTEGSEERYLFENYCIRELKFDGNYAPELDDKGNMVSCDPDKVIKVAPGETLVLSGTQKGCNEISHVYTVSYQKGATETGSNTRTDTITNSRPGIKLYKTDMEGNPLHGAIFTLKDQNNIDAGAEQYITGEDGLITFAYLRPGENYYLTEISAPAGYQAASYHAVQTPLVIRLENDKTTVNVSVDDPNALGYGDGSEYYSLDDTDDPAENLVGTLQIRNKQYFLQIKKIDGANNDNPIPGVKFALYKQVKSGKNDELMKDYTPINGFGDLVTDENGYVCYKESGDEPDSEVLVDISEAFKSDKLKPGTYYLTEKEVPDGYQPLSGDVLFTVSKTGAVSVDQGFSPTGVVCNPNEDNIKVEYTIVIPNIQYSTANLTVKKVVEGTSVDKDVNNENRSSFSFLATIKMPDGKTVWKNYTNEGFINGKQSFRLRHNEQIILKVPVGAFVEVTETRHDWYTTKVKWGNSAQVETFTWSGTITQNGNITFTNKRKYETVTIKKQLSDPLTKTGTFNFTAILQDRGTDITTAVSGINSFTINVNNSNGSKSFSIPKGSILTVSEIMTEEQGLMYTQTCNRENGRIQADGIVKDITFTNTRNKCLITISKTLVDSTATESIPFEFNLTLYNTDGTTVIKDYELYKNGNRTIKTNKNTGVATFTLTATNGGAEESQVLNIPYGAIIKITEKNKEGKSYTTTVRDENGVLYTTTADTDGTSVTETITDSRTFAFKNMLGTGDVNLTVSKEITGTLADTTKNFQFAISGLTNGQSYNYTPYTSTDGTSWQAGTEETKTANADGEIIFDLSHHQKAVISIPAGTNVSISEANGDYTASYIVNGGSSENGNETGNILLSDDTTVAFTNTLNAVAPTNYSSHHIPFIFLLLFGFLLITIGGVGFIKKKRSVNDSPAVLVNSRNPIALSSYIIGPYKSVHAMDIDSTMTAKMNKNADTIASSTTDEGTEQRSSTGAFAENCIERRGNTSVPCPRMNIVNDPDKRSRRASSPRDVHILPSIEAPCPQRELWTSGKRGGAG